MKKGIDAKVAGGRWGEKVFRDLVAADLLGAILNPYHSGSGPKHLVPIFLRLQQNHHWPDISEVNGRQLRKRRTRLEESLTGLAGVSRAAGDSSRELPVFPLQPCFYFRAPIPLC